MTDTLSKADALELVAQDTLAYANAKENVETARANLFRSIRVARTARATQQEIADRTVTPDDVETKVDLSRQRVAQIIQEG